MNTGPANSGARGFGNFMVSQTPVYDNLKKKKVHRDNQVIGRTGIIRPTKRKKHHYL